MSQKIVDIIIPAWKAQKTIGKLLASIASQSIINECRITIVNDGDEEGYKFFIDIYSPIVDIYEIKIAVNSGPGVARQHGIENTQLPYIVFADADDSFATPFTLEILLNEIKEYPKTSVVIGRFLAVDREFKLKLQPMQYNLTSVDGKIYRRSFLQEKNIKFLNSRSNEDAGFNHLIYLLANKEEEPIFLDLGVYCWEENSNSLTANDNFKYKLNLPGFVDNMIYAIKKANLMPNKSNYKIIKLSIEVMVDIYLFYEELKFTNNNLPKENFEAAVRFYNEIYRVIEEKTSQKILEKHILEEFTEQKNLLIRIIPQQGFSQFIKKLKNYII